MMTMSSRTKELNGTDKLNGHVTCSNDFFGDPMPSVKK